MKTVKDAIVIVGRFQPFHLGHKSIIDAVKKQNPRAKPVIALIKSKGDQNDPKRLFPSSLIKTLIDRVFYDIIVIEVKSANILEIGDELKKQNYVVAGMYAGSDRVSGYRTMINRYKEEYDTIKDTAFVKELPRVGGFVATISATKVRAAIASGDFKTYSKMEPKQLATEAIFKLLQTYI